VRHKVDTIVFAQGWLGNQLEVAAEAQATKQAQVMGQQVLAQWKILDEGLDNLLKERQQLIDKIKRIREAVEGPAIS
jgi:hypothetical protein